MTVELSGIAVGLIETLTGFEDADWLAWFLLANN